MGLAQAPEKKAWGLYDQTFSDQKWGYKLRYMNGQLSGVWFGREPSSKLG